MIKVLLKYFYIESNETHSPTKPTQVARLHAQTWCQPAEEEGGGGGGGGGGGCGDTSETRQSNTNAKIESDGGTQLRKRAVLAA